jgi:predicted nucleic acid-binding protein
MDKEVPADASTLIYIARADAFTEVSRCVAAILVIPAVWREAVVDGERIGAPEVPRIRAAHSLRRVELSQLDGAAAATISSNHRLGAGESEVIALGQGIGYALVDEGRGVKVARSLRIRALSTLFLPVLGRRSGGLDAGEAVALLHRLAAVTGARAEAVMALERRIRRT